VFVSHIHHTFVCTLLSMNSILRTRNLVYLLSMDLQVLLLAVQLVLVFPLLEVVLYYRQPVQAHLKYSHFRHCPFVTHQTTLSP
jgi:hypothetical protein